MSFLERCPEVQSLFAKSYPVSTSKAAKLPVFACSYLIAVSTSKVVSGCVFN